jgi:hypothetical protein
LSHSFILQYGTPSIRSTTTIPAALRFPKVADNPIRVSLWVDKAYNLSIERERWDSFGTSSWTSSTNIHFKTWNAFIIFEIVKRTESDSGAVIRISGGLLVIFLLFFADVSPCLISIVKFSSPAYRTILRSTSLFNALRRVTYIGLMPFSFI